MIIDGILELLQVLDHLSAVLKVWQYTSGPALVKEGCFIVGKPY
jgi:hypothetical protein